MMVEITMLACYMVMEKAYPEESDNRDLSIRFYRNAMGNYIYVAFKGDDIEDSFSNGKDLEELFKSLVVHLGEKILLKAKVKVNQLAEMKEQPREME